MQDPNEDTEWNDVLRAKGILPAKPKELTITEQQLEEMVENTIDSRLREQAEGHGKPIAEKSLDELDEIEDELDEEVFRQYRMKRLAELKELSSRTYYGTLAEISGQDYVNEVTNAGKGIWVVLHLYANGVRMCALINHYLQQLAVKFPETKFIKSIAVTCIPNFPEKNLPTIFIYHEGKLRKQYVGPLELRGEKLTINELEWLLGEAGAVKTSLQEDPKTAIKDNMLNQLKSTNSELYS